MARIGLYDKLEAGDSDLDLVLRNAALLPLVLVVVVLVPACFKVVDSAAGNF